MDTLEEITASFDVTELKILDSLNLLNRHDVKFLVNENTLSEILTALENQYSILEIDGIRNFQYKNQYFDTNNYSFYMQHHNGKLNRAKVRYRCYADTNTCFFEIKKKDNTSFTRKDRLQTESIEQNIKGEAAELVFEKLNINPDLLEPKLIVQYKRMTLLNPELQEKITIDTDVQFSNAVNKYSLIGMAIIEIKQKRINQLSPSIQILKSMNIHSCAGWSKYCMGLILTNSSIKYNRFKKKVLNINKLNRLGNGLELISRYSIN